MAMKMSGVATKFMIRCHSTTWQGHQKWNYWYDR